MKLRPIYAAVFGCVLTAQTASAHYNLRVTSNFDDRPLLQDTINNLASGHVDIDDMAVGPGGEWMIVAAGVIYHSASVSASMVTKVQQYIDSGRTIDAIAIAPNGSWVVAADDWFFRSASVPLGQTLQDSVKARQNSGFQIDEIVFTPADGFVLLSQGYYHGQNVPSTLWAAVIDADQSKRRSRRISIGNDGRWVLLGEQWAASEDLNSSQKSNLKSWQRLERSIDHFVLGSDDDYLLFSHNVTALKPPVPMRDLEYSLLDENGVTKNIWERMEELGVPGVTVALIHNGEIEWSRGYGDFANDDQRFVRSSTPYSVASLSKYVAAMTAMRRVKAGTIGLTTDAKVMSDDGYLNMSWWQAFGALNTYYGTNFPYGMTLERLLAHNASMNHNDGDPQGWGGMIDGPEASTLAILLGYGCDGAPCAFLNKRVWHDPALGAPNSTHKYSNAGYEVVRGMLEDIEGAQFEDIAQTEVFTPLGMTNSTFEQPLTASFNSRSAPPVNGSGNAMTRESYQWSAGGGLYASAQDYAKAMMVLINLSETHSSGFLNSTQTSDMLEDRAIGNARYGFGIGLSRSQVTSTGGYFEHGGYIPYYSRSRMIGWPVDGSGVVAITNDGSNAGQRLVCEIEKAYRANKGLGGGCW
jgi:CubicO group peptidase (beta-lactamase class C family)